MFNRKQQRQTKRQDLNTQLEMIRECGRVNNMTTYQSYFF